MRKRTVTLFLAAPLVLFLFVGSAHASSNPNGRSGQMPAYYDGQQFTINFKLLKPDMHSNPSFNTIYQCDSCQASGLNFVSVLDAIQGDGSTRSGRKCRSTSRLGTRRFS